MHIKPVSFIELFEFLKYTKTKSVLQEIAMATAKAKAASDG
jgi:hypothetical protein